ncbi:MAG: BspA family leucine-rich repeat surface protein [Oscillospiraceae bacterium]|nr:BspA family leucine-rich repeat surface protein [Oscillospiraceae bacterium]
MKNKRSFFGRLLRGAAGLTAAALLLPMLPALKADAAEDDTLCLSGVLTQEDLRYRTQYCRGKTIRHIVAKKGTVLKGDLKNIFERSIYSSESWWENGEQKWKYSYDWGDLESVDLSKADTSNVTSMAGMFRSSKKLKSVNLGHIDTSNVINMSSMFDGCSNLTDLNFSFDTSNVKYISGMFRGCSGLTALDLTGFDTSNVTDMSYMFSFCSGLTALDLTGFDTSNVKYISGMFNGCSGLTALDLTGFDTSIVTDMSYMFRGCSNLRTILVSKRWNTDSVYQSVRNVFHDCNNLKGGNGTSHQFDIEQGNLKCDESGEYEDLIRARMDAPGKPGYLTGVKTILAQPQDSFVPAGDTAEFTVVTTNDNPTYQWQYYHAGKGVWAASAQEGANGPTLRVPATAARDGQKYRCIVKWGNKAKEISAEAALHIAEEGTVVAQPEDTSGFLGQSAVFTVTAAGTHLKYQWQYNNGHGWRKSTMEGCNTPTLTVPFLYYRNGQQYRCVVTDSKGGKHFSAEAAMSVRVITQQPENVEASNWDEEGVFSIRTKGYNLKYQWQCSGGDDEWKPAPGNNAAKRYYPYSYEGMDGMAFRCVVTGPSGFCEISETAYLSYSYYDDDDDDWDYYDNEWGWIDDDC